MFQFGWYPAQHYANLSINFMLYSPAVRRGGLPHSETVGLRDYDSSPTTIAVICVLPRHEYPRHPLSTCSVAENKGFHAGVTPVWTLVLLPTKLFTPPMAGIASKKFSFRITPYDATTCLLSFHNRSFTYAMEKVVQFLTSDSRSCRENRY